jgi:hypothetical protein
LTKTDPKKILKLLICVKKIHNFGLVSDSELSTLIVLFDGKQGSIYSSNTQQDTFPKEDNNILHSATKS